MTLLQTKEIAVILGATRQVVLKRARQRGIVPQKLPRTDSVGGPEYYWTLSQIEQLRPIVREKKTEPAHKTAPGKRSDTVTSGESRVVQRAFESRTLGKNAPRYNEMLTEMLANNESPAAVAA